MRVPPLSTQHTRAKLGNHVETGSWRNIARPQASYGHLLWETSDQTTLARASYALVCVNSAGDKMC